jgi:transcriptional regulator with XRE-family HTH domain
MELRIKEICKEKGISISKLGSLIGVSRSSMLSTIGGNPTIGTLEKISNALNISIIDLFDKKGDDYIHGYIKVQGQLYEIKSLQDLEKLLKKIQESKIRD